MCDDIDELAALVADAFVAYREFAHAGWEPPPAADEARRLQRSIADPGFWGEVGRPALPAFSLKPLSRWRDAKGHIGRRGWGSSPLSSPE